MFAIRPVGVDEAVRRAFETDERHFANTRWSDALSSAGTPAAWGGVQFGSRLVDSRTVRVDVSPADASGPSSGSAAPRAGIGEIPWLGCAAPSTCWRAAWAAPRPPIPDRASRRRHGRLLARRGYSSRRRRLRLAAEMRLPGRAWLNSRSLPIIAVDAERHRFVRNTGSACSARLYWFSVFPFHGLVFGGMTRAIARRAAAAGRARPGPPDTASLSQSTESDRRVRSDACPPRVSALAPAYNSFPRSPRTDRTSHQGARSPQPSSGVRPSRQRDGSARPLAG